MNSRKQPARIVVGRRVIGLCAALSIASLVTACGGDSGQTTAASGKAPAGLLKAGQLSVCTDPEYPPMEYLVNGDTANPTGFDSDGARALGKLWEVDVTFQNTSFDGLIPALNSKRCDITWSALYVSPEREQVADGIPFMTTGPGLLVRSGDTSIKTADDLAGKTIAVQGGGSNELTLKGLSAKFTGAGRPGITIQSYPKTAETVAAVTNGKADGLIETDVAIVDMVSKSDGKLTAIPGVFPTETKFGIFTRKGSELTTPVTDGIKTLIANGTLPDVAKKYGLDPTRLVSP